MLLKERTAIISGAAGPNGIGFATAKAFAAQGARVAILDINTEGAQAAERTARRGQATTAA